MSWWRWLMSDEMVGRDHAVFAIAFAAFGAAFAVLLGMNLAEGLWDNAAGCAVWVLYAGWCAVREIRAWARR